MPQKSKGARLYLYKRKGYEPVWYIRDGTFSSSTGCGYEQRQEADAKLAEYILQRNARPDTRQRDIAKVAVLEVLVLYSNDTPENKPSKALIGFHTAKLRDFWGEKYLSDVKGSTCRAYAQWRAKAGVKESTARRELKTLQAAINHWHKESPLEAVPKVTLPQEGARRERVLERSEVARMLWACRKLRMPHVARFILIGVYTGTRHAAIVRLRWEASLSFGHIDTERGIIFRRGSAERETSKRRPPVQIPKALLSRIQRWKKADLHAFQPRPYVINYMGNPIRKLKRAWRTVCNLAGLDVDVKPHTLRHTCATWNLWAGKSIWDVAGIIGADATTVQKVYGHHKLETSAKPVAKGRVA